MWFSGYANRRKDLVSFGGNAETKNFSCSVVPVSGSGKEIAEAVNHVTSSSGPTMEMDFAADDLQEGKISLVRSTFQDCRKVDATKEGKDSEHSAEVKKQAPKPSTVTAEVESDPEEEDVKVCDICGDAGLEDLLAVCSRCTDGAEHTYCMRDMLDKVPEGNWLCEECKIYEEVEKQRLGNSGLLDSKERIKQQTSDTITKLNKYPGSKTDNNSLLKEIPNKRPADSVEVEPAMKRQTFQSLAASSSPSSSGNMSPLARDNSFKSSGSFVKSNSFGTSSSKPKVSLVDEIPQKHKQGVDWKDASRKLVGRSVSFKGNINRSSTTESKVKMLSPEDSQILESRGLKQAKDRNIFERKNSTKSDYPSCSQMIGNAGKLLARGEVKKLCPNFTGSSSLSGTNSVDAKANVAIQVGLPSSSSRIEGSLTNHGERTADKCFNNPREVFNVGSMTGIRRGMVVDSSSQSSKEGANEENKLKAAIQAAMQKKMDMDRKNKVFEKSNSMSVPNADSVTEIVSGDKLPNLVNSRNHAYMHGEAVSPGSSDNCKEANIGNSVQGKVPEGNLLLSRERDFDFVSSYGRMILQRSAIPEREFIWQGSFEVHRDGTIQEQMFGFQAHLSSCASSKVSEIARKFTQKVALDEVPRLCTWPTQFKDGGADEDNIALYFFAKDQESYQRSYKYLLEKMMKDDLALTGTIDGVELLIFPSKHLALKSQRWNMLFFLWGVFRRRASHLDMRSHSEKHDMCALNTNPHYKHVTSSFLTPSEKACLPELEKLSLNSSNSDDNGACSLETIPLGKPIHPSANLSNGNCGLKGCSVDQSSLCGGTSPKHHDKRSDSLSESHIATRYESSCTREHSADKMVADCPTALKKEVFDDSLSNCKLKRSGDQVSALHGQRFGGNPSNRGSDFVEEENSTPVELENSPNEGQSQMDSAMNQQPEINPMRELDVDTNDLDRGNSLVQNFQPYSSGKCLNEYSTCAEVPTCKSQKSPLSGTNDMCCERVALSSSLHESVDNGCTSVSLENNCWSRGVSDHDSADSGSSEKILFPVDSSQRLSVVNDSSRGRVSSSSSALWKDDRLNLLQGLRMKG